MLSRPKVSILLITYNHAEFIAQAIESILAQETSYSYVIHVIEDCSTDNTQEVVMKYVNDYPEKVVPHFNKKNIGRVVTQRNFFRGLKEMNGEYFAVLEGDDYWSSKYKLQKQIDFLESNPVFVACAHNTIKIYQDGSKPSERFIYSPHYSETHDIEKFILIESFFHASSMMMRNVFNGKPPLYFSSPWSCDIFMNIAICQYGKVRYFDEDMSIYRAHSGGMFSNMSLPEAWFFNIGGLQRYNWWLKFKYLDIFAKSIARYCKVVISGTGKDGVRQLYFMETIKYSSLYLMYIFIYALCRVPYLLLKFIPAYLRKITKRSNFIYSLIYVLFSPFYLTLFIGKLFLSWLIKNIYFLIVLITPHWIINKIRELENENCSIKQFRMLLARGELFTSNGYKFLKYFFCK